MKLQITEDDINTYHNNIDIGEYFFIDFPDFVNIIARKML
jgi:hypothetical protein